MTGCDKKSFAALRARRLGVSDADVGKKGLEDLQDFVLRGEGFEQEFSAGAEVILAEVGDEFGEFGGAGLVGVVDSGEVGGEVGEDEVGGLSEGLRDFLRGVGVFEVGLDDLGAGDGLDGELVDGDDFPAGVCELGRHLGPSAGGGAEVDNGGAGFEEAVGLVDLQEFESGARAVSVASGGADKGVLLLLFPPLRGAGFGAAGHFFRYLFSLSAKNGSDSADSISARAWRSSSASISARASAASISASS